MASRGLLKPKGSWKTVTIDPTHCSQTKNNDLISLEELSDYTVVTKKDKKKKHKVRER